MRLKGKRRYIFEKLIRGEVLMKGLRKWRSDVKGEFEEKAEEGGRKIEKL